MAEKFKVRDRVRVKRYCSGAVTGKDLFVGSCGGVLYAFESQIGADRGQGCSCEENWIRLGRTKIPKPKPYKFALQYELDEDSTEYFHDIKEVKKRVKELASNPDLKKDQVFVHEIKNTKQITITSIIGIKFVTVK